MNAVWNVKRRIITVKFRLFFGLYNQFFPPFQLILDEEMKSHHEFELFDSRTLEAQSRKLKVQKTMTYRDLYKFIAANLVFYIYNKKYFYF